MRKIKKTALVLGVTGQDGSFMAKLLLKKKYLVHGFVRQSATGNLTNISELINNNNFKIHHGDLLDFVSITNVISKLKPNEIYNFADQDHVKWSFEIPTYSFGITGGSVLNLLEIIKKFSPKSKYFQPVSSNMFGNSKNKKQNENEPLSPLSIYALGKVTAYHACKLYRDVFNLKIYGAIFYNHESEIRPEQYVTRKITKAVARIYLGKQKELTLGDIKTKIDWGYAKDYVEIAHKIVQSKKPDFYIIATGKQHTVEEFVKKCFAYVGLNYKKYLKIDKKFFRPSKTVSLVGDTRKAQRVLKYKVKTNLDKLISIMMENDLNIENQ
tara:strand:+ start:422 stop:1399 length:978 start_codon:yes stop_codon:yes gene_type:complete